MHERVFHLHFFLSCVRMRIGWHVSACVAEYSQSSGSRGGGHRVAAILMPAALPSPCKEAELGPSQGKVGVEVGGDTPGKEVLLISHTGLLAAILFCVSPYFSDL